jgi:hypothetical protein
MKKEFFLEKIAARYLERKYFSFWKRVQKL